MIWIRDIRKIKVEVEVPQLLMQMHMHVQCKKIGKIFTGPMYKLPQALQSFQMSTGPLFEIKLHLLSTVLLSGFQSSP